MSLFITRAGFDTQGAIQQALASSDSPSATGYVAKALSKAVANVVIAPLDSIRLVFESTRSGEWKQVALHIGGFFLSSLSNALLAVILLVTLVVTPFFGAKAVGFAFDGKQDSHPEKYQTLLTQYTTHLLQEYTNKSIANLIEILSSKETELTNHLNQCLHCLEPTQDPREAYQEFVKHLDEAATIVLQNPNDKSNAANLAKQLAYIRWGKVNLTEHFKKRIQEATQNSPTSPSTPVSFETLSNSIRTTNQQIRAASSVTRKSTLTIAYQNFRGTLGVENFTGNKNTPNRLAEITANDRTVHYLRHGSPTMGKDASLTNASERIAPNYELFIKVAEEKGEGVFYAIHQRNFGDSLDIDDERGRTHAILALQNDHHPNFHAIVQPVEGEFFNGTESNTAFKQLQDDLTTEFFEPKENSSCVLPEACKNDPSYKEVFKSLITTVHTVFFPGIDTFTPEMRQTFILIFYALQRMELRTRLTHETYPISYYVTACKDNLDRGGGQALLELALSLVMTNQENDETQLNNLITNILGAPIIVKQKEMLVSRLTPILKALDHIGKNKETIKKALSENPLSYKPTQVALESGSTKDPSSPGHD